jgi:hypothetical protein
MIAVDCTRPSKLFRYSRYRWAVKSLLVGEFRVVPASDYRDLEADKARQDDELVRRQTSRGEDVVIKNLSTGQPIRATGDVNYLQQVGTNYYTICMSSVWDPLLFDEFKGSTSCLIIHNTDEFCELVHHHVDKVLKDWIGWDAAVSYLSRSPHGPAFTKPWTYLAQKEWRFAWMPRESSHKLTPFFIQLGNIERFAELVRRPEG